MSYVSDPAYADVPGIQYKEVEVGHDTYRFAQDVPTLLPDMLKDLVRHQLHAFVHLRYLALSRRVVAESLPQACQS